LRTTPEPNLAGGSHLNEAFEYGTNRAGDGFVRVEEHFAVLLTPDEPHRETSTQLPAGCLIADSSVEPSAQNVQLGLGHRALESEKHAVVEQGGVIDPVAVGDQSIGNATQVQQAVPVRVVASQAGDLDPKDADARPAGHCPLERLNEATQAWVELKNYRRPHREIGSKPLERYLAAASLARPSPTPAELRRVFRAEALRTQRKSDGTLSLHGRRFEAPARFRHVQRLHLRYASWDLPHVDLVDAATAEILTALYPLDKRANASGRRRIAPTSITAAPETEKAAACGMAPLLADLLAEYAATGLPPAYLPKQPKTDREDDR
jgi:hypothetical protein